MRSSKSCIAGLSLAAVVLSFGSRATSEVTGITGQGFFYTGKTGATVMMLVSPDNVDGINGEMTFDSALFSSPDVAVDLGSPGFTALGHETAPGRFRFVLYKNPADSSLDLGHPVLRIYLTTAPDLQHSFSSTVNFTMAAAARIIPGPPTTVLSVTPTTFQSFEIFINGNAAKDWTLYE